MNLANWMTWILQTAILLAFGIAGYLLKCTLAELKTGIEKNAGDICKVKEENAQAISTVKDESTQAINAVKTELNDLKADLPFIYVLREDFIRSLNNVDTRMRDMDGKLDKLLQIKSKGDGS